jgi:site-specific DNA recombinase
VSGQKAALYCRVSSKGQAAGDKVSLREQEIICRDICVKQGLEVAGIYIEARSATSDEIADRPELARLLADAEAGRFAYMVAYHQDRVSRNMDAGSEIAKRLRRAKVALLTGQGVTDFRDRTSKLMYQVQSWSSEGEAERIAQRTWGAKRSRGQAGQFTFAQKLYGYRWNPKERRPEPVPEELEVVEFIFEQAARHHTSHQIARMLTEAGYRPRLARRWCASGVAAILGDERYAGKWLSWSGDFRPPKHVEPDPADEGKEWLADPKLCPEPAVPRKVWAAAQKSKAYHKRRTGRPMQHAFLLSGLARCAHCGAVLTGRAIGVEPMTRYYGCSMAVRSKDTKSDCPAGYIPALALEEKVWAYFEPFVENPEVLRQVAARTERDEIPAKREELERLERAIGSCEAQIDTLLDKLAQKLISDERFRRAQAKIDADRAAWQERAAEARAFIEDRQAKAAAVDAAIETLAAAKGSVSSFEGRRQLLRLLGVRIEIGCEDWRKRQQRDYDVDLGFVDAPFESADGLALVSGLP